MLPYKRIVPIGLSAALLLAVPGCVLSPRGAEQEKAALEAAGAVYRRPFEQRALPELSEQPDWREVLRRAFLANGDLEGAYFEWAAAVSRIQQAGAYPNTPLSLGFDYMFSSERMKSFDRLTVTAAPDAMENLALPTKVMQQAKLALAEAEAAGKRFAAAKFALQRRVLSDWAEYALLAEQARVQRENVALLRLLRETAEGRVRAGAAQQDLLRIDIEHRMAEDELRGTEAELPQMRAKLNAMLGRAPEAELTPPATLPAPRALPVDDLALLAAGVSANPELAGLARQAQGGRAALELARMQWIPDFNPTAGFTGTMSKFVGVMVSLPTVLPEINGMVKEAKADVRRMEAMYRQAKLDRAAEYVAAVYVLRDAQRQAELFEGQVLPLAERVATNVRQSYAAGTGGFLDLIEAQRTLLRVRLMAAEARATREKALADIEALAGVDAETLGSSGQTNGTLTRPATRAERRP